MNILALLAKNRCQTFNFYLTKYCVIRRSLEVVCEQARKVSYEQTGSEFVLAFPSLAAQGQRPPRSNFADKEKGHNCASSTTTKILVQRLMMKL
jgi:hypothetical protein